MDTTQLHSDLKNLIQQRKRLQEALDAWDKQFNALTIMSAKPDQKFIDFIGLGAAFFVTVQDAYDLYRATGGAMRVKAFAKAFKAAGYLRRAFRYQGELKTIYTRDENMDMQELWATYLLEEEQENIK